MQNSNNQVSVQNGIQAQQEVKKLEQDSVSYEEFEAMCRELDEQYGIKPIEINPELLKPIESEKYFEAFDEITQKGYKQK